MNFLTWPLVATLDNYNSQLSLGHFSSAILGSYIAGLPNYQGRCQQMTRAFAFFMFLPLTVICQTQAQQVHGNSEHHQIPEQNQLTEEQKLLYYLLRNYERTVRPVRNASNPVVVKFGLTLTNIFDIDEKNQVLTTNVWLDQEWNDELLTWKPSDFFNIESIRIPCDLLWLPDIVLYNNADDYTKGYMRSRAMVYYDGTVFWPLPTQMRSTCKIDVTYFPFDSQFCFLKFGSWTYHGYQVDITNRSDNVDLSNYAPSGEFDLLDAQQRRKVVRYSCCPEPYPDVTFYILVRRKTLYYMYNVVFPCMMMSALTLLVFCLPPDSGEKIAMGITVLLAFSVFVLAIAEKMPETSDSMPLIGIYLTVVMAMTSVSVVMTVMVLNFHHRGPFHKELPRWLRWLVLEKLRRMLCMKLPYENMRRVKKAGMNSAMRRTSLKFMADNLQEQLLRDMGLAVDAELAQAKGADDTGSYHGYQNELTSRCQTRPYNPNASGGFVGPGVFYENLPQHQQSCSRTSFSSSCACNGQSNGGATSRAVLQNEVLKTMQMLISRQELDDEADAIANEWRQVAQVIDRMLFWIFFTATVIITLVLLIIIPLVRHHSSTSKLDEWIENQIYTGNRTE